MFWSQKKDLILQNTAAFSSGFRGIKKKTKSLIQRNEEFVHAIQNSLIDFFFVLLVYQNNTTV